MRDPKNRNAARACLAALALTAAGLTGATVAHAQLSVNVDVPVPEVTIADPAEVTVNSEPPDPVYEEQTESPGGGYAWVGGSWGWTGSDWGWYPGRWLAPPEGRVYVEPYYERVGPNVVYVPGYWGARDAPRRSYGGERLRFAAPPRPFDYRRGEHVRIERRPGAPPGARPAGFYEHAHGEVRPIPRAGPYHPAAREAYPAHVEHAEHVEHVEHQEPVRGGASPHEMPAAGHGAPAPHPMPAAHPAPAPAPHPSPAPQHAAPRKK